MGKCECVEYWEISIGKYSFINTKEPMLSLKLICYCDHMGSVKQILAEGPLGLSKEASEEEILKELKKIPWLKDLSIKDLENLAKKRRLIIGKWPCPYCNDP